MCVTNGRITPEYDNFTSISSRGKSVVDYILTPYDCLDKCVKCEVDLPNELVQRYDCLSQITETCKVPDHSMITLTFEVEYGRHNVSYTETENPSYNNKSTESYTHNIHIIFKINQKCLWHLMTGRKQLLI